MAAAQYNFTIEQGVTTTKSFVWKSSEGTSVDLTGYSATMQIRRNSLSDDVLLEASLQNGMIYIDAANGKITLNLSAEDTEVMTWGNAMYDIRLEDLDGVVTRLVQGVITVSKEITRA